MFSLLYFARSEAIKRNQVVTICKSNNAETCGGSWTDGWIVFVDEDKDGIRDYAETIVLSNKISDGFSLSWSAFGSNNYIRFNKTGLTLSQNGTFKLCPYDGDNRFARAVVISKLTRVRITSDSNRNGVYEDATGKDITCP